MSTISSARLLEGIKNARRASADTLLHALSRVGSSFSEAELSARWLEAISRNEAIFPFGWYQPPPNGISILIGNPTSYERLNYRSLRDEGNFPSKLHSYSEESVIYPYFSAIDRATFMIGDHVATYYGGKDSLLRDWLTKAYGIAHRIAGRASVGMRYSDIYLLAKEYLKQQDIINTTFSQSAGLAADIGHTIPLFSSIDSNIIHEMNLLSPLSLAARLAGDRKFVSEKNWDYIQDNCAFTIEPQMVVDGLPMASFHLIVVFINGRRTVVEEFGSLFDFFGMTDWIMRDRESE